MQRSVIYLLIGSDAVLMQSELALAIDYVYTATPFLVLGPTVMVLGKTLDYSD